MHAHYLIITILIGNVITVFSTAWCINFINLISFHTSQKHQNHTLQQCFHKHFKM